MAKKLSKLKIKKSELKELEKEGLTEDIILQTELRSPVQLRQGEEPVKVITCTSGYWVKSADGFINDVDGKLMVINITEAIIGRARYELNHPEAMIDQKINQEVVKLKARVKHKVKNTLQEMGIVMHLAGKRSYLTMDEVIALTATYSKSATFKHEANKLATNEFEDFYKRIYELYSKDKIDELYVLFLQKGSPELGNFTPDSEGDMKALIKLFHVDYIENTAKELQEKGHLYMVAKSNILKEV